MLSALLLAGSLMSAAAAPAALPPTPRFRYYGVSDGLPSSRIYTTAQDADGFLWVGTMDGLARFDGRGFRLYRHDSEDPASLAANDVSVMLVDAKGQLWVGGESNGLNRLDSSERGFEHWWHDPDDPKSLGGDDVLTLAEGHDGQIWVGVYAGGLNRLSADGSGFEHWRHDPDDPGSLSSDNVLALHMDAEGRLWIGTDSGVDVLEPDGALRHIPFADEPSSTWVWQIRSDSKDLWFGMSGGLYRLGEDGALHSWPPDGGIDSSVYATLRDHDGNLWVSARNAMHLYRADGEHVEFASQPNLPDGFRARLVNDIQQDSQGGLWFSGLFSGLLYLSPDWREFSRFERVPENPHSLASSSIASLARTSSGKVLAGGVDGGLDLLDPLTGKATRFAEGLDLPATSIASLAVDGPDRVWINMQGRMLLRDKGKLRRVEGLDGSLGSYVLQVLPDHSVISAPANTQAVRVRPDTLVAEPLEDPLADAAADRTYQLSLVGDTVWRASGGGLSMLPLGAKAFEPVTGVEPGRINAFAVQGDVMWLVRRDRMEKHRLRNGKPELERIVGVHDGYPSIEMNRLIIDARGRVWMTSRVGLWRFDPERNQFRRYDVADGLPSAEFTSALIWLDDDIVLAGTLDGIVGFEPARLDDHTREPGMVLEQVSILRGGKRTVLDHHAGQLDLLWNDNNLRVAATAISFVNPERTHYRFRMSGFDSDWVATGNEGAREFPGLRPGHYTLEIQVAGPSETWSASPRVLTFVVQQPPWNRPLAWLLYLLAALLLAVLAWRLLRARLRRRLQLDMLNEQRRLAEEANEAKTRFLATMGHEIRTPMTGVLGMAELLGHTSLDDEQAGMVRTIRHSGEVLLKLVNDALDLARIEAGRFELEHEPLDPVHVLREVASLESGLASSKGVAVRLSHSDDVPARVLGDAIRLRQILLNLLSNALKFTERGEVRLNLDMQGEQLRFRVSDTGKGMDADLVNRLFRRFEQGESGSRSGGSGLGLAICKELTGLMGGTIAVESKPGAGSTFSVILPLPACVTADAAPRESAASMGTTQRVLLVEDDAVIARVLSGLLAEQGHQVTHAADALTALAEVDSAAFDALLVDIDLPDLDGFELIRMLRARPDGQRWHILVVTARSNRDDEVHARDVGADGFLRKPVTGQQLRTALAFEPDR